MKLATRNKQPLKYALLIGVEPVYALDDEGNRIVDYVDEQGVTHYRTTGDKEKVYSDPIDFSANIAFSGGETRAVEFGINDANYDASLIYTLSEFPINETSLVWYKSEPTYIGVDEYRHVDPNSADYKVLQVKDSLNFTKVLLGKLVRDGNSFFVP